jgi:hypothetical protein
VGELGSPVGPADPPDWLVEMMRRILTLAIFMLQDTFKGFKSCLDVLAVIPPSKEKFWILE